MYRNYPMFEQSFVLDQKARPAKPSSGLCFYSLAKSLYSNFLIFSLGEKHHNILRWTIYPNLLSYTWQVKKSDLERTPRTRLAKAGLAVWHLETAALLERTAAPGQQLAPHLPSPALPPTFPLPLLSKLTRGEATSWKGMAKTPERAFKAPLLCSKVLLWLLPVCRELATSKESRGIDVLSAETSGTASFLYLLASTQYKNIHDQEQILESRFIWMWSKGDFTMMWPMQLFVQELKGRDISSYGGGSGN